MIDTPISRDSSVGSDKATINSIGMGRLNGKNAVVTGAAGCVKKKWNPDIQIPLDLKIGMT